MGPQERLIGSLYIYLRSTGRRASPKVFPKPSKPPPSLPPASPKPSPSLPKASPKLPRVVFSFPKLPKAQIDQNGPK